jgi:hypothetical protein
MELTNQLFLKKEEKEKKRVEREEKQEDTERRKIEQILEKERREQEKGEMYQKLIKTQIMNNKHHNDIIQARARHAVAVSLMVLIHALLGLASVSAMPWPGAPSRSGGLRLQCPHCIRGFKTDGCFRKYQAVMAHDEGKTGCSRNVAHPMSSG